MECFSPEGCWRDRGEDGIVLAGLAGDGDAEHLDVDHVARHLGLQLPPLPPLCEGQQARQDDKQPCKTGSSNTRSVRYL